MRGRSMPSTRPAADATAGTSHHSEHAHVQHAAASCRARLSAAALAGSSCSSWRNSDTRSYARSESSCMWYCSAWHLHAQQRKLSLHQPTSAAWKRHAVLCAAAPGAW